MPFVAFYIYSFISGKTEITSKRRILAAGVAGYLALTAGAFATGVELGLQPMLHTVDGGALFPYGLSITVPAMLIQSLLFFSFVEAILTALAFAYIARSDPTIIFNYTRREEQMKDPIPTAPV
jgi:cobalt/nickel transport system permease protein